MTQNVKENSNIGYIFLLITCCLILVSLICSLFQLFNSILLGLFGVSVYLYLIFFILFGISKIAGYKFYFKKNFIWLMICIFISFLTIIHYLCALQIFNGSYADAINGTFSSLTTGGLIISWYIWPFAYFLKTAGTIVIFFSIALILTFIAVDKVYHRTHITNLGISNINSSKLPKKSKNYAGSLEINQKVLNENQNKPSFLSMPLTLNAKQAIMEENKRKNLLSATNISPLFTAKDKQNDKQNNRASTLNSYNEIPNIAKNNENIKQTSDFVEEKYEMPQKFLHTDDMDEDIIKPKKHINDKDKIVDDIVLDTDKQIDLKSEIKKTTQTPSYKQVNFDMVKEHKQAINSKNKYNYIRPPYELLTTLSSIPNLSQERFEEKAHKIELKLEEFKISAKCVAISRGPAITRYEFEMPQGISVNKITNYSNDIAMVLEAKKAIRIEAPIPGKNAFGIEVPNDKIDIIGLRDLVNSDDFLNSKSPLTFALGKDLTNRTIVADISKLVHTLIAGSTGSGKSVCLNAIIVSLIYKSSPMDVRIILIDPKYVEFNIYEKLPHLLLPNIITEPNHAVNALTWVVEEMERRNRLFGQNYVRNIDEYNEMPEVLDGTFVKIPRIVVIVDELADLMLNARKEIEEKILKLSQKARSSGIHLILATQRPSVDIITGTIKANLPSRIAFSLTNYNDSKTIIDQGGAEKLLGRGDMLYLPRDISEPIRLLAPYISQPEVASIVDYVKKYNPANFDKEIQEAILIEKSDIDNLGFDATSDEYFVPALRMAIEQQQASTSFFQRRFSIGFNRASRIVEQMESLGYISKAEGSKPRIIFITMEEFIRQYGD